MSQLPQTFTFDNHALRTAEIDGTPWFAANDVCAILGYFNPRDAVAKHCKGEGVAKRDTLTSKGMQPHTYINEANLYRLIIKSRKPEAEAFERLVMEEILPAIRKTGRYQSGQADAAEPSQELQLLRELRVAQARVIELQAQQLRPKPARKPNKPIMPEEVLVAKRLRGDGMSLAQIAREMERSAATVSYMIRTPSASVQ